jgi:hypothetical protein
MAKAVTAVDPGPKPALKWISKRDLKIDARYQRALAGRRSQALIERLIVQWRWAHCLPLVITDNCDGTFNVIDGQHRLAAAQRRDDIATLPCYLIETDTLQDEAVAFVAFNRDRVQMTGLAVYHASVAARDPHALEVAAACKAAGVIVLRAPKMVDVCEPGELQCVGALRTIVRAHGGGHLGRCLKILTTAWRDQPGAMRSALVNALALAVSRAPKVKDKPFAALLGEQDPEALYERARLNRHGFNGRTVEALAADIGKRFIAKAIA